MATIAEALVFARQRQQAGDHNQAESIYRQILQVDPANAEAIFLLGTACQQLKKLQEAAFRFEQALVARPQQPEIHNALGMVQLELGQRAQAKECFQRAIGVQPNFVQAHHNMGNLLHGEGRLVEAEVCFRQSVALAPNFAEGHFCLGCVLQAQNKVDAAVLAYRQAIRLNPNHAVAYNNLGDILNKQGNPEEAAVCFQQAIHIQPNFAELHYNLGSLLQKQGKLVEAVACYERAIQLKPSFAGSHNNLGMILAEDGQRERAVACFKEALRLRPDFSDAHNNMGTMLLEEGEQEKAVYHFKESIRLNPNCISAVSSLAIHGLIPFNDRDVERIKGLLATPRLPLPEASQVHFAIANIRNRAGAYDEAFQYFLKGNALRRRHFQEVGSAFDPDEHTCWTNQMIATCNRDFFERMRGFGLDTEVPVFIVGMPRSGTSLVEQILSSHPTVYGAGELPDIGNMASTLHERLGTQERYPECLARLDRAGTQSAAQQYMATITGMSPSAQRITDKMPGNCLHLGFIAALFPKARVIHCKRDPLDTCVSCFVQYFRGLNFTWDLNDLGRFYHEYERMMAHWQTVQPLPMLEVVHEELVDDQERITRQMVEFCGLPWDDRCLAFHENRRAVRTVSVLQVRKPIFKSSVGRWKRYEAHLQPLIAAMSGEHAKTAGG